MNISHFLKTYGRLCRQEASEEEIDSLFLDLSTRVPGTKLASRFNDCQSELEKAISIDAVAHEMHISKETASLLYPAANYSEIKKTLDEYSGYEAVNEVRKTNRDFFTSLLANDSIAIISKAVGSTTPEDITDAIQEYKALYEADKAAGGAEIVSDAELLTLYRFTKDQKYYDYWKKRKRSGEPLIIGGYGSVAVVDKENHLITVPALREAWERFLKSFRTRNSMVSHSSIQVAWPIRAYINDKGETFKSGVDGKGLYVCAEVRPDTVIADRVRKEVEKGTIRSYSIAGTATKKEYKTLGGKSVMVVNALDLQECTLCESPVNPDAHFNIIKSDSGKNKQVIPCEPETGDEQELEMVRARQLGSLFSAPMRITDFSVAVIDGKDISIMASQDSFLGNAITKRLKDVGLEMGTKIVYEPFGPRKNFRPLMQLSLVPVFSQDSIQFSEDNLARKEPTPAQKVALRQFNGFKILKEHDDGDLTIENNDGHRHIISTSGKIFKEISLAEMQSEMSSDNALKQLQMMMGRKKR